MSHDRFKRFTDVECRLYYVGGNIQPNPRYQFAYVDIAFTIPTDRDSTVTWIQL